MSAAHTYAAFRRLTRGKIEKSNLADSKKRESQLSAGWSIWPVSLKIDSPEAMQNWAIAALWGGTYSSLTTEKLHSPPWVATRPRARKRTNVLADASLLPLSYRLLIYYDFRLFNGFICNTGPLFILDTLNHWFAWTIRTLERNTPDADALATALFQKDRHIVRYLGLQLFLSKQRLSLQLPITRKIFTKFI